MPKKKKEKKPKQQQKEALKLKRKKKKCEQLYVHKKFYENFLKQKEDDWDRNKNRIETFQKQASKKQTNKNSPSKTQNKLGTQFPLDVVG